MTVLYAAMIGFGSAGLGYIICRAETAWKEAGERVDLLADPDSCDWCISLTGEGLRVTDCKCRRPCPDPVTWCGKRRTVVREGRRR